LKKHISFKAKDDELDDHEVKEHLPNLMWVLRDFSMNSVEINARELNADEYLE